jgi:preprotein translocase subunit SecF
MENKETKESIFEKALKETKKPGFLTALMVFFCCVIIALVIGFIFDTVQLAATIGIGLGLVWMGVAYLNQKE